MRWVCISIQTSTESEDVVSNLLLELGSGGVQIDDEGDNSVTLKAYFPTDDMTGQRLMKLKRLLEDLKALKIDIGAGRISVNSIAEKEWTETWKEFFKPLAVGKRILVFPSWEIERVQDEILTSQKRNILVQIDPGMAFGTGRHSTTILCLELLEDILKGGETVLDVGTGSGILAIAAAKMGAKVLAIDVDQQAAAIAKENARLNNVNDKISILCGDRLDAIRGKYQVIVSNISARIILSMLPKLRTYLSEEGLLILSGILGTEASEIQEEIDKNRLVKLETRWHEEWVAFLVKNRI